MNISKVNNCEDVNSETLHNLIKIACKALEIATVNNEDKDILSSPKTANELEMHNDNINNIITAKLKIKFNM